jgi:DNA-binding transcriptional regulator YhcF (GntR family)
MTLKLKLDRSKPIHLQISAHMRRQIETGALKPDQPLLATTELAKQWNVNFRTVQKALNGMKKAGLLRRTPGVGTFVQPLPKPVSLAVLLGPSLTDEYSFFYRAVLKELRAQASARGWTCRAYDGLSWYGQHKLQRVTAHRLFGDDHLKHQFNGLITVGVHDEFWKMLNVSDSAHTVRFGAQSPMTDMSPDYGHFASTSVEYLAGLGLRRVVYLRTGGGLPTGVDEDLKKWSAATRRFGLNASVVPVPARLDYGHMEPDIYQAADRLFAKWKKAGILPEAVVIPDDIGTRAVALALIRNQIDVPGRLRVLTWANEGVDIHYGIPVIRYQISPSLIARRLMDIVGRRIAGEVPRGLPASIRGGIVDGVKRAGLPEHALVESV